MDAGRAAAYACALDVLYAACFYNVQALKVELIRAERGQNGNAGSGSFKTLINILLGEQHVPRTQAYDVMKMVLDGMLQKEDQEICEIFYEHHFPRVVEALKAEHGSQKSPERYLRHWG